MRTEAVAGMTPEEMLRLVKEDAGERVGWAAKNDDSEAVGLFIGLIKAIDAVLGRYAK